ncbi:flavoprotein-like protein [Xylogone sp. PMI_703]|nr:flavoprotein-like protein [Xylogone sp. PMI_703]
MRTPKIAIVYYSTYGHVRQLALREKKGVEKAGGTADLFTIRETLSPEILAKMGAPPKPQDPIIEPSELAKYDRFVMGVPTRLRSQPSQWRAFWEKTVPQWNEGAFSGKFVGIFVSTASPHSGAEATVIGSLPTLAHHGLYQLDTSMLVNTL